MKRILSLAFILSLPSVPQQQPDPDSPLIRVTVNLVQVDAIVTDKSSKVITDLSPDDFDLRQDGTPPPARLQTRTCPRYHRPCCR